MFRVGKPSPNTVLLFPLLLMDQNIISYPCPKLVWQVNKSSEAGAVLGPGSVTVLGSQHLKGIQALELRRE